MRKLNESEKQILALKQERRIKKGISSSLTRGVKGGREVPFREGGG